MAQEHGYNIESETKAKINLFFNEIEAKIGELGNGRFVRNIFDRCIANQCNRLAVLANPTKQDLTQILHANTKILKKRC